MTKGDREILRKYRRRLSPAQDEAMTAYDVDSIHASTWRALTRMGLARTVVGRNGFRAFTSVGLRLRRIMRSLDRRLHLEVDAMFGGAA